MSRVLFRHAVVLTMDERLGDLPEADVLVEDGRIAAVGPGLDVADASADVEDARGCVLLPGLVNAHMHTWQTALRGVAANWTLPEYFRWVHAGLATRFTPDDIHVATLAGALNQLNCGTTTLVDWCHNNPTPDHTDAAVSALSAAGIRAAFFHGSPKPDARPGEPAFWEVPHPRTEVERLLRGPFASRDGLLSLGLALLGPHYSTLDVALQDFRLAKEFGLIASVHQGGGLARSPGGWARLMAEGLVDARTNVVHGNDLTDDEMDRFLELGASFSACPENEMIQGHGFPVTGRLRRRGAMPSVGVDVESVVSGEMLTVARTALSLQRALDNAQSREAGNGIPNSTTIPVREALRWVTTAGAQMLGMEDRIGSVTPGKQADLLLLRSDQLNLWPLHDPAATVVMHSSLANVDAVMVAGRFRKRRGRLLVDGLASLRDRLAASGARIASSLGIGGDPALQG